MAACANTTSSPTPRCAGAGVDGERPEEDDVGGGDEHDRPPRRPEPRGGAPPTTGRAGAWRTDVNPPTTQSARPNRRTSFAAGGVHGEAVGVVGPPLLLHDVVVGAAVPDGARLQEVVGRQPRAADEQRRPPAVPERAAAPAAPPPPRAANPPPIAGHGGRDVRAGEAEVEVAGRRQLVGQLGRLEVGEAGRAVAGVEQAVVQPRRRRGAEVRRERVVHRARSPAGRRTGRRRRRARARAARRPRRPRRATPMATAKAAGSRPRSTTSAHHHAGHGRRRPPQRTEEPPDVRPRRPRPQHPTPVLNEPELTRRSIRSGRPARRRRPRNGPAHHQPGSPASSQVRPAAQHGGQEHLDLHAGEVGAEAVVGAEHERQRGRVGLARRVEALGVVAAARVAVGRREEDRAPAPTAGCRRPPR